MILFISKTKKHALALSEMFRFMGIPSFASTAAEGLSHVSPIFKAIIIIDPDALGDKADYIKRIHTYAHLPVFAIKDEADCTDKIIFDGVIKSGLYAAGIYNALMSYADEKGITAPGRYRLAGIDASVDIPKPTYFDRALPFTKTEAMIIRTLISTYPAPTKAKAILGYAFRQTKLPEEANIRTHVSVINKKFRERTGRNLIVHTEGVGYRILTPEIMEALIK